MTKGTIGSGFAASSLHEVFAQSNLTAIMHKCTLVSLLTFPSFDEEFAKFFGLLLLGVLFVLLVLYFFGPCLV